jgi:serine/threonine protein kinase
VGSTTSGPTTKTYEYCAPEVADGTMRGRSSDVFSLGCVFLEIISVLSGFTDYEQCKTQRQDGADSSFHANLDSVGKWVRDMYSAELKHTEEPAENGTIQLLYIAKSMLHPDRMERPSAMTVWTCICQVSLLPAQQVNGGRFLGPCCLSKL